MIIGGGVMGQSLAYNLWRKLETMSMGKAYKTLGTPNIVVVEKDPAVSSLLHALLLFCFKLNSLIDARHLGECNWLQTN